MVSAGGPFGKHLVALVPALQPESGLEAAIQQVR
jgi:hypothetical protein